jgi:predicted component of type VI protein secretion system
MAKNSSPETLAEWRRLIQPQSANQSDTPYLEGHYARLSALLTQVEDIEKQQAALTAAKQETSKQLKAILVEGRKVAAFIKAGLREKYGRTAEKLVEFGLRPFRGKKTAKPEAPEVKPPAPTPTLNA